MPNLKVLNFEDNLEHDEIETLQNNIPHLIINEKWIQPSFEIKAKPLQIFRRV